MPESFVFYRTKRILAVASMMLVLFIIICIPGFVYSMAFDPPPFYKPAIERLTFETYRWEKPSFYYVNSGLPLEFFDGVEKLSELPTIYNVRGVEYGFRASGWPSDKIFLQFSFPYESVYLKGKTPGTDEEVSMHELRKGGDVELAGSALALGSRQRPMYLGLNGWVRLPTGSSPFDLTYPLMSSGKGATQYAGGLIAAQKVGRFSFFQGLNYENTGTIPLRHFYSWGESAVFKWPYVLHAAVRLEFQFFKRSYRCVAAYYDLRMRQTGVLKYGTDILMEKDRVYFSTGGLLMKVDSELIVTGQYSFFPFEFNPSKGRPDFGGLLMIAVAYTPL